MFRSVPTESDFKRREAEIEKSRQEIAALQERIKRLVKRKSTPQSLESSKHDVKSPLPTQE
jgi:flagellar motility protein MotE (MotC chaperone)